MKTDTQIDGPDYLETFADRLISEGAEIEAMQFRRLASQWRQDQAVGQLAADEATFINNQLNNARRALTQARTN
jgi:hypothetical protein